MLVYSNSKKNLEIYSLDKTRWDDFETLFGDRGGCGGCWCMSWRLRRADFERQKGSGNKSAMKKLVDDDNPVGVLAYIDGKPAGWCAVAPREEFLRLKNSRVWKPIDNEPVWSVTCFFVAKPYRRKGLSVELIKGAVYFCMKKNVKIIEGYPVVPYDTNIPDAFAWTGIPSAFLKAGFTVAERRSERKPIMRCYLP